MAANTVTISDEKLDKVLDVLEAVGLEPEDRDLFSRNIRNDSSYAFGGEFEWAERAFDTRFFVALNSDKTVKSITVGVNAPHYRDVKALTEKVQDANKALADILQ